MMKTKLTFLALLLLAFASCNDKDKINYIAEDQLPEKAQTFLNTYFSDNEFISAIEEPIYGGRNLVVSLKDVTIDFTPDYDWNSIELTDGLPASAEELIHKSTLNELKQREPDLKIIRLHNRYGKEVDIWMSNQKLYSDIEGHEGNTLAELVGNPDDLPEQMKEYINKYIYGITRMALRTSPVEEFPKVQKFAVHKGNIYRFRFNFETFVDFDKNGNWFYVKESGVYKIINDKLIYAVPDAVVDALKTKDENIVSKVRKINVFNDNKNYGFNKIYGFTLDDEKFVAVNSENELLDVPLDVVREYIDKGFNPEGEYKVDTRVNTGGAFLFRYSFSITGLHADPNLKIGITTNARGDMRRITSGVVSTDHTQVTPLPRAIVEMLPHPIADYLDEHYTDWKAVWIDCAYSEEYGPEIPQQTIDVQLSVPNNLKTVVFDYNTGEFIKEYLAIQR